MLNRPRWLRSSVEDGHEQAAAGPAAVPLTSAFVVVISVAVFLVGAVARLWPRSALWLDEAQSVSFAGLPIAEIPAALREDGAPPLYYIVLHIWMSVFGDTDIAVRSLSTVISLAAMAGLGVFVRRLAGTRAALITMAVFAASPFAVRYGAETRMYALVMLEVILGLLLLQRIGTSPTLRQLAGLAAIAAALLYTHYWSIYLLAAVTAVVAVRAIRGARSPSGSASLRVVFAIGVGGVLWLPWVPTFLFQSERTATPWSRRAGPAALADALGLRFSGAGFAIPAFAVLACLAVGAALFRTWKRRSVPVDAIAEAFVVDVRGLAIVAALATTLAVIGAMASDSALAPRYLSVVFPIAVVLIGVGIDSIRLVAPRVAFAVAFATLSGVLVTREIRTDRTRAETLVDAMAPELDRRGVVVFCPDQLGPAMSRLLAQESRTPALISYLPESAPERVDWIDYRERYEDADPSPFVAMVDRAAGTGTIWLVVSTTYPPTQPACGELLTAFRAERPTGRLVIGDDGSVADHGALWRFDG